MPGKLPLYREAGEVRPRHWHPHGHPGLWWDKFCDLWHADGISDDFSELVTRRVAEGGGGRAAEERTGKLEWMLTLLHRRQKDGWVARDAGTRATLAVGNEGRLAEAQARLGRLLEALGARAFEAVLETPLVTGLGYEHPTENGFLFHRTLGVPFLPGSGLKGLVRSWAETWEGAGAADIDRIFGPPSERMPLAAGSVIFFDALPTAPVRLTVEVTTPHYRPWYERGAERPPADWYDPVPVPFLALGPGARFRFAVAPRRPGDEADAERACAWLREALAVLGAGAKTAVGYGRFGDGRGGDDALVAAAEADRARWRDGPVREPVGEVREPAARERAPGRPATPPRSPFRQGDRVVHPEHGEGRFLGIPRRNPRMALVEFSDGLKLVSLQDLSPRRE